jgi:hypothetical protein
MNGTRRTKCRRKNDIWKMEELFGVVEGNGMEGSRSWKTRSEAKLKTE